MGHHDGQVEDSNSLMTPSSQALALSPPRAPPHGSAHRTVLLAKNPTDYALAHHHDQHHLSDIRHRIMHLLEQSHLGVPSRIPHPHLPSAPEWGDKVTRALGVMLPIPWMNACRDSGSFRSIVDGVITATAPTMAVASPSIALKFVRLTRKCQKLQYGTHPLHVIHMFFPDKEDFQELGAPRGLVFFVHGGAWGSGLPWMYRLVASPFLKLGMAVAIVGYRTWPDGNVNEQVNDLEEAAAFLFANYPDLCSTPPSGDRIGTCLIGHSSGAHISLLMLVDRAKQKTKVAGSTEKLEFHSFVGLSGPYDISHHFDYEAARGVEELSPMKPVCGNTREAFAFNSPALRWKRFLPEITECSVSIEKAFPRMLLVHGIEDATVPFTATAEAARIFRSCNVPQCDEMYVAKIGHQDTVMEVMVGGRTQDYVLAWLEELAGQPCQLAAKSKL